MENTSNKNKQNNTTKNQHKKTDDDGQAMHEALRAVHINEWISQSCTSRGQIIIIQQEIAIV